MLHVEQCTLRSRIEITGAAGAGLAIRGVGAEADTPCRGFAGSVIVR
jgi:hypothetical protein